MCILLASSFFIDVESTFAGDTSVVIIPLTVLNATAVVNQLKRSKALLAPVIRKFFFASQEDVVLALSVYKGVFWVANLTLALLVVFRAFLYSLNAFSGSSDESVSAINTCSS